VREDQADRADERRNTNGTQMKPAQYYKSQRWEVLELIPREATRVLDVGCGAGWLGEAIKSRQDAIVYGIDSASDAAGEAKRRLDRVWNMPVEEAVSELTDGFFDCIVTADILEHLVDPWTVLAQLRRKLAPNGTLVASIPNVGHWAVISGLVQGSWRYETEGLLDRTHLRFFTRRSVNELFWTSGLTIIDLRTTMLGGRIPRRLLKAMRASGLRTDALEVDGRVFQYLVLAREPSRPVPPPRVSIVILNSNSRDDTLECLRSVHHLEYPHFDVVVVDNGSTDGSAAAIRAGFPGVTVIELPANRGHAEGKNVGIRHTLGQGAEHILVLNNDTVVHPSMLARLLDAATLAPHAGLWGPAICYDSRPDTVWRVGYNWTPTALSFVAVGTDEHESAVTTIHEVDSLVGCAMLVSRRVFQTVGLIDPAYGYSWGDVDLCTRARRVGFKCVVAPEAKLWHKVEASRGSETSPVLLYFDTRDYLLWSRRHLRADFRVVRRFILRRECRELLRALFGTGPSRPRPRQVYWWLLEVSERLSDPGCRSHLRARLRGLIDHFRGRYGDCPDSIRRLDSHVRANPESDPAV
jgi:GT2 family glycosyltransferase/2-polyprenyl-3-methyl-5-hydroxy-6-metoxy-1,4-benzoquinol methylase